MFVYVDLSEAYVNKWDESKVVCDLTATPDAFNCFSNLFTRSSGGSLPRSEIYVFFCLHTRGPRHNRMPIAHPQPPAFIPVFTDCHEASHWLDVGLRTQTRRALSNVGNEERDTLQLYCLAVRKTGTRMGNVPKQTEPMTQNENSHLSGTCSAVLLTQAHACMLGGAEDCA